MFAYISSRLTYFTLFIIYLTVLLVLTSYLTGRVEDDNNLYKKYRKNLLTSQSVVQNKHILLWAPFFSSETWYLGRHFLDKKYFQEINCEVTACVVTTYRDLFASVTGYDAILFHESSDWPTGDAFPLERSPLQYYVLANLESHVNEKHDYTTMRNAFNLSMTFRLDSDVVWPYAVVQDQITGQVVAPSNSPTWRTPDADFHDQTLLNAVRRKTKMAAWFVSNCRSRSHRDQLVKAMQQHITIDVYGECGPLKCPRSNDCDAMLDADYKFYMSFENSLCENYVTEKLFNNLKRLIIPVVYGGANYTKFAPPRSYINANDFADAKQLTDYLVYLDQHPEEYVKYFWWKRWYRIEAATPFCDLCKKLHELDYVTRHRQTLGDLDKWYRGDYCHRKSQIHF